MGRHLQRGHRVRELGARHQAARREWAPIVAAGGVLCVRCELPIEPGADWDLDHRPGGSHPAHAGPCNRSAGARAIE